MEFWYESASALLLVVLVVMMPIRVRSKMVVVLYEAQVAKKNGQIGDGPSAQYVRKVETVAGVLAVAVIFLVLLVGYIAPYADWYEFESRIVFFGFVALCAGVYVARTIVAFNKARRTDVEFSRSKEGGES